MQLPDKVPVAPFLQHFRMTSNQKLTLTVGSKLTHCGCEALIQANLLTNGSRIESEQIHPSTVLFRD